MALVMLSKKKGGGGGFINESGLHFERLLDQNYLERGY